MVKFFKQKNTLNCYSVLIGNLPNVEIDVKNFLYLRCFFVFTAIFFKDFFLFNYFLALCMNVFCLDESGSTCFV